MSADHLRVGSAQKLPQEYFQHPRGQLRKKIRRILPALPPGGIGLHVTPTTEIPSINEHGLDSTKGNWKKGADVHFLQFDPNTFLKEELVDPISWAVKSYHRIHDAITTGLDWYGWPRARELEMLLGISDIRPVLVLFQISPERITSVESPTKEGFMHGALPHVQAERVPRSDILRFISVNPGEINRKFAHRAIVELLRTVR